MIDEGKESEERMASNTFIFDEIFFHEYYELHLRPHDKHVAKTRFFPFLIMLFLFCFAFFATLNSNFLIDSEVSRLILLFFFFLGSVVAFFGCCQCVYLFFGRKINWQSKNWSKWVSVAFCYLQLDIQAPSPVPKGLESDWSLIERMLLIFTAGGAFVGDGGDTQFDKFIKIRREPGKEQLNKACNVNLETSFTSSFERDRITRGKSKRIFAERYSDVHDIIEDKKYPELAIIRHCDGVSELVVKKDKIDGMTWCELRNYINKRKK